MLQDKPVSIYWGGKQLRDYVYVKDIAEAHLSVLELSGCNVFNIGSGTGVLMNDVLKEILDITGKTLPIFDKGERQGDPMKLVSDISAINKAVGWKPIVSLHDGLVQTIKYYQNSNK